MSRVCAASFTLAFALALCPVAAQEKTAVATGSALGALPAESTLVIRAANCSSLVAKFKSSPLYAVRNRPQFAKLFADFESKITEARDKVKAESKVDFVELLESVQGEAMFAFGDLVPLIKAVGEGMMNMESPNISPEDVPMLLALDAGAGFPKFKENLLALFAFAVKNDCKVKTDEFQGAKLTVIEMPAEAGDGPKNLYVGEVGSRFLASTSRKFLGEALSALAGKEAPGKRLARDDTFLATQRLLGAENDIVIFAHIKPILGGINSIMEGNPFGVIWQKVQEILIGKTLNSIGIAMSMEPQGLRQRVLVHNGGAGDGIIGWFKSDAFSPSVPPLIPDNVISYSSMSLNPEAVEKAVKGGFELAQSVASLQGGGADIEAMAEQMLGVKPLDIVRSLGKRMHYYTTEGGMTAENPLGDVTIVLDLKDDAPMKKLLEALKVLSGGAMESRKHLGRDIYSLPIPVPSEDVKPTLCVSDKMLLFSVKSANVEKVVGRIGKEAPGLGDKEVLKKRLVSLPAKVAFLSYTSTQSMVTAFESLGKSISEDAPDEIPAAVFELVSAIGGTFEDDVSYGLFNDQGLFAESFTPYRK